MFLSRGLRAGYSVRRKLRKKCVYNLHLLYEFACLQGDFISVRFMSLGGGSWELPGLKYIKSFKLIWVKPLRSKMGKQAYQIIHAVHFCINFDQGLFTNHVNLETLPPPMWIIVLININNHLIPLCYCKCAKQEPFYDASTMVPLERNGVK